jgi:uncharacterized integral membrane protein (TIGR02327 family)
MDLAGSLSYSMGIMGMVNILVTLVCIAIAWWAVQQFKLDLFLKQPRSGQAKILQILISIVFGYELSRFLMDYFSWSSALQGLF